MKKLRVDILGNNFQKDPKKEAYELESALNILPPDLKTVIHLYYSEGISKDEISIRLNCTVPTISIKIKRSILLLKRHLNPSTFSKAYKILYPETGKPTVFLNASEHAQENNQNDS